MKIYLNDDGSLDIRGLEDPTIYSHSKWHFEKPDCKDFHPVQELKAVVKSTDKAVPEVYRVAEIDAEMKKSKLPSYYKIQSSLYSLKNLPTLPKSAKTKKYSRIRMHCLSSLGKTVKSPRLMDI